MKVQKLGIEWGAAFAEAEPHNVQHGEAVFQFFADENYDLIVKLPTNAVIESDGLYGFRVRIPA